MGENRDGETIVARETDSARSAPLPPGASRAAQIREQLDRILSSPGFQGANRRVRLLRYLVERTLEDQCDSLKESVIATEVFDRAPDYDPQVDSVVRVEVGRLRSRLAEYYGQAGQDERVRIEIPKGGYRPVFVFRDADTAPEARAEPQLEPSLAPVEETAGATPRRRRNWILALAGGLAIALLAGAVWRMRPLPATPASIAVLPFLNLSGDPAYEYLGDGISEEVTEALAQSSGLRVVARTSAFQYKGKSVDVREIGRNLGAGAILEGSIARRGEDLHVVAQLIRSRDGYHLWSQTYDGAVAELPAVEERITRAIGEQLHPSDSSVARAAAMQGALTAKDPEAHDLYLRAAYEFSLRTADSTRHAIELATEATQKDRSYAQPYVLMAASESQLTTLLVQTPHAAADRARQDVTKALDLDPGNHSAHAQKAMLDYIDRWDWPQAEREFRLALAEGSHGSAENLYGWCLMTRGRFPEARRHLQVAAELDPLSLGPQLNQVEELIFEARFEEAKRKDEEILRIAPGSFVGLALASSIAFSQRDCLAATLWSQKLLRDNPQVPFAHFNEMAADLICGRQQQADRELEDILNGRLPGYISPYPLASLYAERRDADRAVSYLKKSADLREPTILYMKIDRRFDKIRQDPRIVAIQRQIGLLD